MTLLARSRGERRMDISLEKLRILRSMGVVAVPAIHDRSVYVQMSLAETRPLRIVALPAQGLDGLAYQ